ncbi:hypothetical protein V8C37DRAFT_399548 [Trichoderma ceciliae]
MDVPRGSRRARHATSTAASSQEAQIQAQAQLELEAATHQRRNHQRRQALQAQEEAWNGTTAEPVSATQM